MGVVTNTIKVMFYHITPSLQCLSALMGVVTAGKILTKEYQATSDGDARKKALMPMEHQSILLIRKIED